MIKKINIFFLQLTLLSTSIICTNVVQADTPFIGEVRWFAGNFAPRGWQLCNGQLLAISSNSALFSILGTTYGGDGRTTFGLPDLRGRAMLHEGRGAGLTPRAWGEKAGTETETLSQQQLPTHNHALLANQSGGDSASPVAKVVSKAGRLRVYDPPSADTEMSIESVGKVGGAQDHNNLQPFITINCIIATEGVFPSRS